MNVVKKIAMTGRTVLCTIHQPSEDVFNLFDSLLLLRAGGSVVYFGDLGESSVNLVNYFEAIPNEHGICPKRPDSINPASWMLDVIGAGNVRGWLCTPLSRCVLRVHAPSICSLRDCGMCVQV